MARPEPVTSKTTPDAAGAEVSAPPPAADGAEEGAADGAAAVVPVGAGEPPLLIAEMRTISRTTPPTIHGHLRVFFGAGGGGGH